MDDMGYGDLTITASGYNTPTIDRLALKEQFYHFMQPNL